MVMGENRQNLNLGKWAQGEVPHRGWDCVGVGDLGEPAHLCEMCERAHCRYVHTMEHPEYPETLAVGRICAENMEGVPGAAKLREEGLIRSAARRRAWASRSGWHLSKKGNPTIKTSGLRVTVFKSGDGYGFSILRLFDEDKAFSKKVESTPGGAKLAAFDEITRRGWWDSPRPVRAPGWWEGLSREDLAAEIVRRRALAGQGSA